MIIFPANCLAEYFAETLQVFATLCKCLQHFILHTRTDGCLSVINQSFNQSLLSTTALFMHVACGRGSVLLRWVAIRCVLPVLRMTSRSHTVGSMVRHVCSWAATVYQQKLLHRFQPNFAQRLRSAIHIVGCTPEAKSTIHDFPVFRCRSFQDNVKKSVLHSLTDGLDFPSRPPSLHNT